MSPFIKLKLFHCSEVTKLCTSSRLCWWPVAKLSNPVTFWLSLSRVSSRLEPIKPATPVISQVLGCRGSCSRSRSEEHTSELQSRPHLVCRLLLEKKKKKKSV